MRHAIVKRMPAKLVEIKETLNRMRHLPVVLAALVVNKLRGGLKVAAVKAPGFGDRRKAMLQDVAILPGGQVISEDLRMKLENVGLDMLDKARKISITKDETTLVDGASEKSAIDGRVAQIRSQIEDTTSDTTRRSFRSVWRSSPAGLGSSGSAAPRRSR